MARSNKIEVDAPWIGYVRVSTREQAASGLSLEAQRDKIEMQAKLKEVALKEIIVDAAESAKSLNRPGVQQLMEMVRQQEVSGVIIAKLDRLTRSVRDLGDLVEMLQKSNVALISTAETFDTSTAGGRMILNIIATIAQWEREVICERTRDGLAVLRKRGEHAGNVRYGYQTTGLKKNKGDGLEVPNEAEQEVIEEMERMSLSEHPRYTLKEIAEKLNEAGYKTRRGTAWRFQYVASVLSQVKIEEDRKAGL